MVWVFVFISRKCTKFKAYCDDGAYNYEKKNFFLITVINGLNAVL